GWAGPWSFLEQGVDSGVEVWHPGAADTEDVVQERAQGIRACQFLRLRRLPGEVPCIAAIKQGVTAFMVGLAGDELLHELRVRMGRDIPVGGLVVSRKPGIQTDAV